MGLDAEVIAIGPFSQQVVEVLEYPPDYYVGVENGALVIVHVFLASTSKDSHALANAFGVGTMELGKHHLDSHKTDMEILLGLFGESDVNQFTLLRSNGFEFYYAPNA